MVAKTDTEADEETETVFDRACAAREGDTVVVDQWGTSVALRVDSISRRAASKTLHCVDELGRKYDVEVDAKHEYVSVELPFVADGLDVAKTGGE